MCENSLKSLELDRERGVILGFWDQEKTPIIIKELENSVDLIEAKCKKLFEELMYYQFYLDELSYTNLEKVPIKTESGKNGRWESASVPDIAFRKAVIQSHNFEETFHNAFTRKLSSINEALFRAGNKIGLKENLFLFPTGEYLEKLKKNVDEKAKKCWSKARKEFVKSYVKKNVKSDLALKVVSKKRGTKSNVSKITMNDLDFYKKLSKINLSSKRKNKKLIKTKKISPILPTGKSKFSKLKKFRRVKASEHSRGCLIRRKPKCTNHYNQKSNSTITTSYNSNVDRFSKSKVQCFKSSKRNDLRESQTPLRSSCSNDSDQPSRDGLLINSDEKSHFRSILKNDEDIDVLCQGIINSLSKQNPLGKRRENTSVDNKGNISSLAKKAIPFTPCRSTTKSHNVGVNIQQFISLRNLHKKLNNRIQHYSRLKQQNNQAETMHQAEQSKAEAFQPPVKNSLKSQYFVTTYPWSPKQNPAVIENDVHNNVVIKSDSSPDSFFSNNNKNNINNNNNHNNNNNNKINSTEFKGSECNRNEHSGFWVSKRCANGTVRKFRSRYTKTTPESFIQFHKSTTKHYKIGQGSMLKTESKSACSVGPNILMSGTQEKVFFEIKKQNNCNNASGDGCLNTGWNKLKKECSRNSNLLFNLYRKYYAIKEFMNLDEKPANTILKAFENEIDHAMEKYKEFLYFYERFLQLKQQLKTLKEACEGTQSRYRGSSFFFSASYQRKTEYQKNNTYSMVLKETLRKVQDLKDRIRVID